MTPSRSADDDNLSIVNNQLNAYLVTLCEQPLSLWPTRVTSLWMRSRVDCAKRRSRARAMLQMQSLIASLCHDSLGEAAAAAEAAALVAAAGGGLLPPPREALIFATCIPPRWGLERVLGTAYCMEGMFGEAASLFSGLELWNDVVDCTRMSGDTDKAERIVRARLGDEPSPRLWCVKPSRIPPLRIHLTRAGIEWRRCRHAVCMAQPCEEPHHSGWACA